MRKYKPTIHTQIIYTSFPKVSAFSIAYVKKKKKKKRKANIDRTFCYL